MKDYVLSLVIIHVNSITNRKELKLKENHQDFCMCTSIPEH